VKLLRFDRPVRGACAFVKYVHLEEAMGRNGEQQSNGISRRKLLKTASAVGAGIAVAPALASAAPAPKSAIRAGRHQDSGEVRFLVAEAYPDTWNPYQHQIQIQRRIENLIFDPLIRITGDDFSVYTPALAESWTTIDDTTTEFKLRQGVTFHKGQPFTAADVKATIEFATGQSGATVVSAARFVPTTVEIVDDATVRLKTATPFAPLFNELSYLPIVAAENIPVNPATPSAQVDLLASDPNGTGPFSLIGNDPNIKSMAANASYWGGAPAIATLVWEYIADSQTRLNALLAKQAHAIDRVPPEHLPALQADSSITLQSKTGFENVNLWMRQDAVIPPWDTVNLKLREAVMLSLDREAIVSSLIGGASEVALSHVPNHAVYAKAQEPAYALDREAAKQALIDAGYPDGQGPDLPLWGVTGFLPRGKEVAEAIADSLTQTGFNVQLQVTDIAAMIDGLFDEAKPGVFFHLSWSSNGDPHGALSTLYHSPSSWGANDPHIDELIDKGAATVDSDARGAVYDELQAYLWQNLVHFPLYNSDFTIATVNELQGVVALPNFFTYFDKATLASS
jgi:peptide/nickel transport system substrate-binding protein